MLSKIENFNFYLKTAISDFFLKMKIEFFDSGHDLTLSQQLNVHHTNTN